MIQKIIFIGGMYIIGFSEEEVISTLEEISHQLKNYHIVYEPVMQVEDGKYQTTCYWDSDEEIQSSFNIKSF